MAATQSTVLKHWARIIKRWPIDKVRPENVSFQTVMQKRIQQSTSVSSTAAATSIQGNEALVSAKPPPMYDEAKDTKQINVLYSLLENRLIKAYPLPEYLRKPASNPTHYDDLIRELQEAPSRSWFGGLANRIKGSLRFR